MGSIQVCKSGITIEISGRVAVRCIDWLSFAIIYKENIMKRTELIELLKELAGKDLLDGANIHEHPCSIAAEELKEEILTNDELLEAIKATHAMIKGTCGKGEHWEKLIKQLDALLAIQMDRI